MCQTTSPEQVIQIVKTKDISLAQACAEKDTPSCQGTCTAKNPSSDQTNSSTTNNAS